MPEKLKIVMRRMVARKIDDIARKALRERRQEEATREALRIQEDTHRHEQEHDKLIAIQRQEYNEMVAKLAKINEERKTLEAAKTPMAKKANKIEAHVAGFVESPLVRKRCQRLSEWAKQFDL